MHQASWLNIRGANVFVQVSGTGIPVLCVHTAGQSGVQYREVLQELPALGYQVIVLDMPGHGRSSPWPEGPISDLHTYAEICWEVLQQLEVVNPFVVGCSIGGKISLDLSVHHGDKLSGIVAMEADAFNGNLSVAGLKRSMSDSASPSQGERTYYGTFASLGVSVPAERAEEIALMHRREDSVITTSDLIGWTTHDLREKLSDVACPALLVVGEDDFWVEKEEVQWAANTIHGAKFLVLEGIGHYPMEEVENFPKVLAGWLSQLVKK